MLWTARSPNGVHIQGNLYLGRQPRDGDIAANQIDAVFDLAAELPAPTRFDAWHSFPMQDLLPPDRDALCAGADALDRLLRHQRVWVCCALGFSRSSAMVCAWLIRHGDMRADAAISLVEVKRPQLVLSEAVIDTLYSLERAPT